MHGEVITFYKILSMHWFNQVCQGANFDPTAHYRIADQGTEELWIDNDDGPYLYYTGSGNRYGIVQTGIQVDH